MEIKNTIIKRVIFPISKYDFNENILDITVKVNDNTDNMKLNKINTINDVNIYDNSCIIP